MCNHKNVKEYKCEFCELEKLNYYGYDSEVYNLAYTLYCNYTDNHRQSTYRRLWFTKTSLFKKFYDDAKSKIRADKINSLYEL